MAPTFAPLVLLGAGHMGGALIEGWSSRAVVAPGDLLILDPAPGEAARRAAGEGARLDPSEEDLAAAKAAVLAVRPQGWRKAASDLARRLPIDAKVISIMAGVPLAGIAALFAPRPVCRVMPNLPAAIGEGAAALFSPDPAAAEAARALFSPIAEVIEVEDEALLHAVTAVAGSGPAYLYAFAEALAAAGEKAGLPSVAAARMARRTVAGAAALMARSSEPPTAMRQAVASKGGTTEAALEVLLAPGGLCDLLSSAVERAAARSRELAL
ncbi:MAG: pyrroline-5-carboxylate reductase [Caulobacteraceae bacterium]